MLSCGALVRSNNQQIESIVDSCISKNQKEILAMWVLLESKSERKPEAMKKSIHKLKVEFVYLCV